MRLSMSGQGLKPSIAVVVLALAAFAGGTAATAEEDRADAGPSSTVSDTQKEGTGNDKPRDYYTRRASELLKKDAKALKLKPHPLAVNHPEHFVVVCEAGCLSQQPQIVFMEPMKSRKMAEIEDRFAGADDSAQDRAGGNLIHCIAGCFGETSIYRAPDPLPDISAKPSATPTEKHATKTVADTESGNWLVSINRERARDQ